MSDIRAKIRSVLVVAPSLLALGLLSGCGEGERMESGTQVQVSDDLLKDAHAQDAYFDEQKSSSKKGAPAAPAAPRDGPGAPQ